MESVWIGSEELCVSRVGLGCVTFGREIDDHESFRILDKAFERGINLFDTAEAYGGGQAYEYRKSLGIDDVREASHEMHSSEKILGRWLKATGIRKDVVIQTKILTDFSRSHLPLALDASLSRLQTDAVDIYLFHRFDSSTSLEEALQVMAGVVRSGHTRLAGCSNFNLGQLIEAVNLCERLSLSRLEVIQSQYNLVNREIESHMLPFCAAHNIAPIVYSPLGAGFLTGKYQRGAPPPSGARFDIMPGYSNEYFTDDNFAIVERFAKVAEQTKISMPELAISWVLKNPFVKSVLIGARTLEQIETACRASERILPEGLYDDLRRLGA